MEDFKKLQERVEENRSDIQTLCQTMYGQNKRGGGVEDKVNEILEKLPTIGVSQAVLNTKQVLIIGVIMLLLSGVVGYFTSH